MARSSACKDFAVGLMSVEHYILSR